MDSIQCTYATCDEITECLIPLPYITIHVTNDNLNLLKKNIKTRLLIENIDKKEENIEQ